MVMIDDDEGEWKCVLALLFGFCKDFRFPIRERGDLIPERGLVNIFTSKTGTSSYFEAAFRNCKT